MARERKLADATTSERTLAAMRETLAGGKRGFPSLHFFGPAVIASIAYMDPGNFATNIQAGAGYGYALLWVVLAANLIAMLFQGLSAKLGIVTRQNLAEICRDRLPKPAVYSLWILSEFAAMATDLAEFVGGAIGLSLLFHLPLIVGMGIVAVLTFAILHAQKWGFRPIELVIGAFVITIGLCYLVEVLLAPINWPAAARGMLVPSLPDGAAVTIAVGIVGATVMPHALFLHSGLTSTRAIGSSDRERRALLGFSNREVVVALAAAGLVNLAMVLTAAAAFHPAHSDIADIATAYRTLTPVLGAGASAVFLIALLASGVSSSAVGTMAGQMVMQGFVGFRIPLLARRLITIIPAFIVIGAGVNPTQALIYSQVALSFALPAPMIALVVFTGKRDIMGDLVNSRLTQVAATVGAVAIIALNVVLVAELFA
jgi:manganese transport protein